MRRICVFCGSSVGARPEYASQAAVLGVALAREGIGLVYGGSDRGLMGALSNAVLAEGGEAIGVIPEALVAKEVAHRGLRDLRIVGSMHERKALMADLADGFLALPGGTGTLEELFEILTWAQLGLHAKPVAVLNVCGYFDRLLGTLDHAVEEGFLRTEHRSMLLDGVDIDRLFERMRAHRPVTLEKWITEPES